jgi:glutamate synthase domain-containing protein 2
MVGSQANPFGICGGQSGTGTSFSSSISLVGVPVIPPLLYAHSSVTDTT